MGPFMSLFSGFLLRDLQKSLVLKRFNIQMFSYSSYSIFTAITVNIIHRFHSYWLQYFLIPNKKKENYTFKQNDNNEILIHLCVQLQF